MEAENNNSNSENKVVFSSPGLTARRMHLCEDFGLNSNLSVGGKPLELVDFRQFDAKVMCLELQGFLDKSTVADSRERVLDFVEKSQIVLLVLDLKNLSYINSEGIGLLMMLATHLANEGGKLFLFRAADQVKDIFDAVGIFNIIPHFDQKQKLFETVNLFLTRSSE